MDYGDRIAKPAVPYCRHTIMEAFKYNVNIGIKFCIVAIFQHTCR